MDIKRVAQATLIASLLTSAALGIFALISFDTWGPLQTKVWLTSLTVTGASIAALACSYHLEKNKNVLLAASGIAFSILGALLLAVIIWGEISFREKTIWRLAFSCVTLAVAQAHVCLLLVAQLDPKFKWAQTLGSVFIGTLAMHVLFLIWDLVGFRELHNLNMRILGINAILVTVITVLTAIFHKISQGEQPASGAVSRNACCPNCGTVNPYRLNNSTAEILCVTCGSKFEIRLIG
ncbi:MAG: TFIIB-type zinc ribbon-containing protein [Elusimicrobiota bacterium]|nr:TFIIB-type zinc ribbon-containing protein [Elusimicrobiota bacterium]